MRECPREKERRAVDTYEWEDREVVVEREIDPHEAREEEEGPVVRRPFSLASEGSGGGEQMLSKMAS